LIEKDIDPSNALNVATQFSGDINSGQIKNYIELINRGVLHKEAYETAKNLTEK
jgi:hypothetical protein